MLVEVIVDPEQAAMLGYVETWTWRNGYIMARRGRSATKAPDYAFRISGDIEFAPRPHACHLRADP